MKNTINPQMIAQVKSAMQNMNSPQMQMVRQMLSGKNISAQQAVEMLCKQRGINVNDFMSQINDALK